MVKKRKKGITKKGTGKWFNERPQEAGKTGCLGLSKDISKSI
jgi:hypothetical protein